MLTESGRRSDFAGLRQRHRALGFRRRWGFAPPPAWSDWVGYEVLLEEIERSGLDRLDGDVLEIGAFLGGGAAKLCGWVARRSPHKRGIGVDVFGPRFHSTTTVAGRAMHEL